MVTVPVDSENGRIFLGATVEFRISNFEFARILFKDGTT